MIQRHGPQEYWQKNRVLPPAWNKSGQEISAAMRMANEDGLIRMANKERKYDYSRPSLVWSKLAKQSELVDNGEGGGAYIILHKHT